MDALSIFKEQIGDRLLPIIIKYDPYLDKFQTHPYFHVQDIDFENKFVDIIFDNILFYAFEKDEIEKEYQNGNFSNLKRLARVAYQRRIPKTERPNDGLLGELTLDAFLKVFYPNIEMLYARAKYLEKIPHIEKNPTITGQEIKCYDGMVFSVEEGQKYFWVGQIKTGTWEYCLNSIKKDINKGIIKYYFSDSILIMCDIMRAVNSSSKELRKIIDTINEIDFNYID